MPVDENPADEAAAVETVDAPAPPAWHVELTSIRESIATLCLDDLATQSKLAKALDRTLAVLLSGSK